MCASGSTHEIFEPQNLTITIVKITSIMTKSTIQSLKKENDSLKSHLEAVTKDFKALKELLERKELLDRTGQDGGPSSPETENSLQFLSDEYYDLQNFNTAVKQKLSKLSEDLLDVSVKIKEISHAVEALQPYSDQYNINIISFPQANESQSSMDIAKLCTFCFICPFLRRSKHISFLTKVIFSIYCG